MRARWDELTFKINCVEFAFLLVFRYSGKKEGRKMKFVPDVLVIVIPSDVYRYKECFSLVYI